MKQTFTEFLKEWYEHNLNNNSNNMNPEVEAARDAWFSNIDVKRLMDFADLWGLAMYIAGKTEVLEKFEPLIEQLKNI